VAVELAQPTEVVPMPKSIRKIIDKKFKEQLQEAAVAEI
jgi:hypothetical protein